MQKQIRFYFWLIIGIFKRYQKTLILTFIIGISLIFVLTKFGTQLRQIIKPNHQIIGIVGSYTPSSLPINVQKMISLGLTDIDQSGQPISALAKSWDRSDDGLTYTFYLKDNIYWHDGTKFSAADVNYNLKDVTFTAVNNLTLQIKLKSPFVPLPNFLSKALFKKGLIGLGAYKIQAIKLKGENVTYIKLISFNNDLPAIEIKFFATETLAKTAFKLGEINILDNISDSLPFNEWNHVAVIPHVQYDKYLGIFFNCSDDLLKIKETRQGLAFAIEKTDQNRIATPISSKSWAYTNRVKQYDKDIPSAEKLLSSITGTQSAVLTLSTSPQYLAQAQIITKQWEAVGVKTQIKVETGIPTDFQALLAVQEIPSDPDQYIFWHSTQTATNITHYVDPKIDKLLEDGRKEFDAEKRQKIYYDFQRYLVEDAPAIFLYHPTTYTITRK